tara:strand:- start:284 stop:523 length:240 start_codon:yes stop_codon:yes gene_type:complete
MNTLYDRLEPEILKGLDDNKKTYAAGVGNTVAFLKDHYSWLSLTVGQVHSLIMFSDIHIWGKVTDQTFKFGENIIKDEK